MRRLAAAVFVFAAYAQAAGPARTQTTGQTAPPPWLARLSSYVQYVTEHRPGALDMAARLTGFMGEADLGDLRTDLFALVALCKRELDRSARPAPVVYRDTLVQLPELLQTIGLTVEEAARGDANRILKRAAVLHADVAMLVTPLLPNNIGCSAISTMLVRDGTRVGTGCLDIHWAHSRLLLDAIRPDPAKDETVRRWYVASATFLLEDGNYANAKPHLDKAGQLFRSDPESLFTRGYYHEVFASPQIQTVAIESGLDRRGAKSYLEEAEDLYGRAVKEDRQFVEARVRRGYVLSLLGRHRDAAEELRRAASGAQGPQLRYYAGLFLGQAEQSVGNAAAARDRFSRAAALYPNAQSPLLALALLARQVGDRAGVREAMKQVLALPSGRDAVDDPWLDYYRWQNRNYKMRFAALHARLAEEEAR